MGGEVAAVITPAPCPEALCTADLFFNVSPLPRAAGAIDYLVSVCTTNTVALVGEAVVTTVDPILCALALGASADPLRICPSTWAAYSLLYRPDPAPWTALPIRVDEFIRTTKTVLGVVGSLLTTMPVVVVLPRLAADSEGVLLVTSTGDVVLVDLVVGTAEARLSLACVILTNWAALPATEAEVSWAA